MQHLASPAVARPSCQTLDRMAYKRYLSLSILHVGLVFLLACAEPQIATAPKSVQDIASTPQVQVASAPPFEPATPAMGMHAPRRARLEPGCLLPAVDTSSAGNVRMVLEVSEVGIPTKVILVRSTGRMDVDRAFVLSAHKCLFRPVMVDGKMVESQYTLDFDWKRGQSFVGAGRCFAPDYPESALRAGVEAMVTVQVRMLGRNGPLQMSATSSRESHALTSASMAAVERCLAHPELLSTLESGKTYVVPFRWSIRP